MTPMPISLAWRALAVALLLCTPVLAKAKTSAPKKGAEPSAAIPKADRAGIGKVFGNGGKPVMYTNPAIVDGVWPKKINVKVGNGKKQHEIKMAYDDREIAKASRRVFENANPFTIPNNVYTFVILENGVTSFGNPVDSTELGTRHAHLSQGRGVVASGELVKSNAGIRLNFLSGTYMLPLLDQGKHDPVKLRDGIFQWFDKVLRAKYKGPASFKIAFNLKGKPSKDNSWGNEAIFEITKNGGDRLPPPTFCELQTEIHACDAKYGFAKRNVEFCELVNAPKCGK